MVKQPQDSCAAWAEINLKALAGNFLAAKKMSGNSDVIPVVKADAYGHGAAEVSSCLIDKFGVKNLGVARVNEGASLVNSGISAGIIILGGFFKGEIPEIIRYELEPSVFSIPELILLNNSAKAAKKTIKVHLKINTGMNRLGVMPQDVPDFVRTLNTLSNIKLSSVYTHFAFADSCDKFETGKQASILNLIRPLVPAGVFFHAANSAAVKKFPSARFDAVRPGIMLYGSFADASLLRNSGVKPVMTLKGRIAQVTHIKAGDTVSYGGLYKAKKKETIAVVSIGYGDGYVRCLTQNARVIVNGRTAPVIGRVCMDLVMIKLNGPAKNGDEVLLFGESGKDRIPVEELAEKAGTISYEIFTGIAPRVKRIYINKG
jgi:alanine racemase